MSQHGVNEHGLQKLTKAIDELNSFLEENLIDPQGLPDQTED